MNEVEIAVANRELDVQCAPQKTAFVFKGGGVKGIAFAGALLELERWTGMRADAFAGTSAGAITATILAMGYDTATATSIMLGQDFENYLDDTWSPDRAVAPWTIDGDAKRRSALDTLLCLPRRALRWITMPLRVFFANGRGALFKTATFGRFIEYVHGWSPIEPGRLPTAFRQRLDRFDALAHRLLLYTSATGGTGLQVFGPPEESFEFALRASIAIPLFFEPQKVGATVYRDGGILANYTFRETKFHLGDDFRVFGFYLFDGLDKRAGDRDPSFFASILDFFDIVLGQSERTVIGENPESTILIDTSPISAIDFALDADAKELLVESGRFGVLRYLFDENHGIPLETSPTREEVVAQKTIVDSLRAKTTRRSKRRKLARIAYFVSPLIVWLLLPMLGFATSSPPTVGLPRVEETDSTELIALITRMTERKPWRANAHREIVFDGQPDDPAPDTSPKEIVCFRHGTTAERTASCFVDASSCGESRAAFERSYQGGMVDRTCTPLAFTCRDQRARVTFSPSTGQSWACVDRELMTLQVLEQRYRDRSLDLGVAPGGTCIRPASPLTCLAYYDACELCRGLEARLPLATELHGVDHSSRIGSEYVYGRCDVRPDNANTSPSMFFDYSTRTVHESPSTVPSPTIGFRCVSTNNQGRPQWRVSSSAARSP